MGILTYCIVTAVGALVAFWPPPPPPPPSPPPPSCPALTLVEQHNEIGYDDDDSVSAIMGPYRIYD